MADSKDDREVQLLKQLNSEPLLLRNEVKHFALGYLCGLLSILLVWLIASSIGG